jgi:hypothetical protein
MNEYLPLRMKIFPFDALFGFHMNEIHRIQIQIFCSIRILMKSGKFVEQNLIPVGSEANIFT